MIKKPLRAATIVIKLEVNQIEAEIEVIKVGK